MAAKSTLEIIINGTDNFTKDFSKALDKVGDRMQRLGGILTASVTLPIVAMGVKAVSAASDLEESMNKVGVVFGDAAGEVTAFASNAATALGMSNQKALEAAGTFGNLFTAMGIGQDVSAGMSKELLTLAADLASFNNIDPTVALEKLRAGLVGEVEPLRTLGVNLSAAAVEAKALEMGLIREGEELTAAAKAQAAFALIMEQTTNAQGDFARTSDGLSNQQRILAAQFQDTAAKIGTLLLPYALQLVEVLSKVMTWVSNLTPAQQNLAVVIAAVAAAIGPLLVVVGTLLKAFSTITLFIQGPMIATLGSLLLPIAAIVAAVVLLALAWKNNWGDIQGKTKAAVEWIQGVVDKFLAALKAFWEQHKDQIMGMVDAMWTFLKTLFDTASKIIMQVVGTALAAIQAFWDEHGAAVMAVVSELWGWVQGAFETAVAAITLIFKALTAALKGDWEGFGTYLRQAATKVFNFLIDAADAVWSAIKAIDWLSLGTAIVQGMATGIKNGAKWIIDAAKAAALAALAAAKKLLGITSPSKVFAEVGANMMEGMALGITRNAYAPAMASTRAAAAVTAQTTNNFSINLNGTGNAGADVMSSVRLLELLYG